MAVISIKLCKQFCSTSPHLHLTGNPHWQKLLNWTELARPWPWRTIGSLSPWTVKLTLRWFSRELPWFWHPDWQLPGWCHAGFQQLKVSSLQQKFTPQIICGQWSNWKLHASLPRQMSWMSCSVASTETLSSRVIKLCRKGKNCKKK